MSSYLIDKIIYWMNYNGEIGKNDLNLINGISDGSITTIKNRSFIDSIIIDHRHQLAECYINRGINNVKLYLTCLLYGGEEYNGILNMIHYFINNKDKYIIFLNDLFKEIENEYINIKDINEKILFLKKIKNGISSIRYPEEYGQIKISISNYEWGRQYLKQKD